MGPQTDEHAPNSSGAAPASPGQGTIDIERLADRVYRLLHRELRLERARGARPGV